MSFVFLLGMAFWVCFQLAYLYNKFAGEGSAVGHLVLYSAFIYAVAASFGTAFFVRRVSLRAMFLGGAIAYGIGGVATLLIPQIQWLYLTNLFIVGGRRSPRQSFRR